MKKFIHRIFCISQKVTINYEDIEASTMEETYLLFGRKIKRITRTATDDEIISSFRIPY